jgi:tetratricopeptide (TPR) repeat protein
MNDDIKEALEIAITWAVNLVKEKGEVWEPYEILMYYRIAFSGFDDNIKLGIMDGEYILEKFRGKMDLETELEIINILGLLNLYAGNLNQAEYYLREVVNRGEGKIKDIALLNLGFLEGMRGNIRAEYEIYKSLIEKSTDKAVLFTAIINILVLYPDLEKTEVTLDLNEIMKYFNIGLRLAREVKDKNREFWLRYNFAVVLQKMGEFKEAIKQIEEMLKISKDTNINEYADALGLLGYIYYKMGDYEKSIQSFEEALISFDLRDKNFEGRYYIVKANYALALAKYGKVDEARLIVAEMDKKIGKLNLRPDHQELIKDTIEEAKVYIHGLKTIRSE